MGDHHSAESDEKICTRQRRKVSSGRVATRWTSEGQEHTSSSYAQSGTPLNTVAPPSSVTLTAARCIACASRARPPSHVPAARTYRSLACTYARWCVVGEKTASEVCGGDEGGRSGTVVEEESV